IGYSYSRGGTEIGLFDIDQAGQLSYRATYHMRSNDYYSSRNYASRQIGSKLIFYTPLYLSAGQRDPLSKFPGVRKWRPDATAADFERIAPATRIYRTDDPIAPHTRLALHTVTVCDLAVREMKCEATAVLGPPGRVFYVSGQSVYVWVTSGRQVKGDASPSGLFRIPLDGGAPSALKVAGAPIDQFSFLESGDGHLNVMVRAQGRGEGMWRAERGSGDVALLRVPLASFSDGRDSAPAQSYRALPEAGQYGVQNRYVGAYLLYGSAQRQINSLPHAPRHVLNAVRWDGAGAAQSLSMSHGVERIEAMGADAVVIGSRTGDLHFSSIKLGPKAELAYRYVRGNAAQSESRSHGFFYKDERADKGIVGLPITHDGQSGNAHGHGAAASVMYLRNSKLKLDELGSLLSQPAKQGDDGCRASCVDWYGNARPLFLQGRVFALMGYELVEGKVSGERLSETRRISYAPASLTIAR
ncbi:MAG: beta-propeller domain-containing protein, partial [Pseudomonadota bacterium]